MKKFSKRLFTSLVAFCMLFAVSAVPAFAAETTTEITDTQQPVVSGGAFAISYPVTLP